MKKANLFVFWLGDTAKFNKNKFEIDEFNLILGPSAEEHDFLLKKSSYYKKSFENGKFAFCADVWRFYVLSKNRGLYVDASVLIGKNIMKLMDVISKYDVGVFRGNYKWFENGVLWSGVENNIFFKTLLEKYYFDDNFPLTAFIAPAFLSAELLKLGMRPGWDICVVNNIIALPLNMIRDKKTIWKTSVGSWGKSKNNSYFDRAVERDGWKDWEEKFNSKTEVLGWSLKVDRVMNGHLVDITLLKDFYEDKNFKNRNLLIKERKLIKYHLKFKEMLLWSRLHRFFNWFN